VTFKEQVELAVYAHGSLAGISLCEFARRINSAVICCSGFCTLERLRAEGMRGLTAERCARCGFVIIGADQQSQLWGVIVTVDARGSIVAVLT
jgi:hypothetical protein